MGFLSRLFGRGAAAPNEYRPSQIVHEAFGGAVRVFEVPKGKEWHWDEDARDGEGYTVMSLKYILPASPMPLGLLAKIYTIKEGFSLPDDPATTNWREVLGVLFSDISNVAVAVTHQKTMEGTQIPACEAVLDGAGADPACPLRIRERRAVLNEEQFIVMAMGTPEMFAAHAAEIDLWFSTAVFVPISETKTA